MSDPTINAKTSLRILRQTYTDAVLKTLMPRNTDIRDAHFHRQDIFTSAVCAIIWLQRPRDAA
jgi:chromosome partitioning protein